MSNPIANLLMIIGAMSIALAGFAGVAGFSESPPSMLFLTSDGVPVLSFPGCVRIGAVVPDSTEPRCLMTMNPIASAADTSATSETMPIVSVRGSTFARGRCVARRPS